MTSGKRTSSETAETPGARRRRRPAPTIDLTATEIGKSAAAGEVPPAADTAFDRPIWAWLQAHLTLPYVAAGIAGGMLVSLVLYILWLTGTVPIRYAGTTAMRARVSVLEMQLHDLQNRPPPAVDAKSFDELSQRLGKIERAVTTPPPVSDQAFMDRLAAAETAMKSLGIALTALNRRADDAAAKAVTDLQNAVHSAVSGIERGDLDALANRIGALERTSKGAGAPDGALRLALGAAALRDAIVRGEPFAAEQAAVKSLGGESSLLAALEPFAQSGVPSENALARELSALVPELLKASGVTAPREGGFLDRLQANAGKLVRVRPAGEVVGDDSTAVVARIEVKAAQADIAGGLAELNKLPVSLRAPADGWMKKAELRKTALDASRKLAADSFRALGQ